jgi:hypothetical protein
MPRTGERHEIGQEVVRFVQRRCCPQGDQHLDARQHGLLGRLEIFIRG